MKYKKAIGIGILFGMLISVVTETTKVTDVLANSEQLYAKIKILTSVLETIQRAYVEERDPDELVEDALKGVISNLDPHTVFLPADDFRSWSQSFEGYTGIGISFEVFRGKVTVMSVMENSPASDAGIRTGDRITQIDGVSAIGMAQEDVTQKLAGTIGESVRLRISGPRWPAGRDFRLMRERIVLNSVPFALMLRPAVGYVKIDRFTSTTSRELDEALDSLEKQGMKNLVLDLRGNGGGYLNAAVEVADKFIPRGNIIVSTRGRLASSFQEFYSTEERTHKLCPLIVLIDHGSASASEIVAGAIQDLDRGLIAGKTSFGKGLVQSQYRFPDGSALLITTARYYTPSGRPIQRNFFDKSKDEYYRDAYVEDAEALAKAIQGQPYKTSLGRTVYSGDGIKPDVWVETDDNILSDELRQIYFSKKRLFYSFAEDMAKTYPRIKRNQARFLRTYRVTDKIYSKFIDFVAANEPAFSKASFDTPHNRADTKFLLRREMAYLFWGQNARFKVNLKRDRQLNVALRHLQDANKLLSMNR